MTKNEKLRRRIAKLEAELAEARQRLDHLAKGLSHVHAADEKHYWYHATNGDHVFPKGLPEPELRRHIDAAMRKEKPDAK